MRQQAVIPFLFLILLVSGCGVVSKEWIDPDTTLSSFDGPSVKGVKETVEESAKASMNGGDYRRASQFYEQLISAESGLAADKLRYKVGFAESLRRMGDNDRALSIYDDLFEKNPGNLDVAEGRGLTMMATGKVVDAGRAFADIIAKDPKRWRTLNALGILFVTKNMISEAMSYYTEALKYSPDNPSILNNVGLSQAVDKKYTQAIASLQQGGRMSKSANQRKQIEMNLAMVYGVSGDLDTAKEIAGKYLEGAALDNNLGLYAHMAKDNSLAKTYLNMALSQSPTYYERAWNNLNAIGGDNDR